jgi:hypothetical protein
MISQNADSYVASAEMGIMVTECLVKSHERFSSYSLSTNNLDVGVAVADSLAYLVNSMQSQRRWLLSYKARKETAMNLVSHSQKLSTNFEMLMHTIIGV